ncbi:MAG: carbohydrate kinase family protein [Myxococcota bacterium]
MVGVGENSWDRWIQVEGFPAAGEKVAVSATGEGAGGQIATALRSCAELGLSAAYLGAVGSDALGNQVLAPLRSAGVDCSGVQVVPGADTRRAFICVDTEGERTVFAVSDPALRMRSTEWDARQVEASSLLLLDSEDLDLARWMIGRARAAGVPVLLDAERWEKGVREILREVDFPVVSGALVAELSAAGDLGAGLRELVGDRTVMAIATLGARGALARHGDRVLEVEAPRVEVLDTTGAGDVFRGCLAWGLHRGLGAEEVLAVAVRGAALACSGRGAQGKLPLREELLGGAS